MLTSCVEHSPDGAGDAGGGAADVEFEPVTGDERHKGGEGVRGRGGVGHCGLIRSPICPSFDYRGYKVWVYG